jgi:Essential protein Yae1, N terminal
MANSTPNTSPEPVDDDVWGDENDTSAQQHEMLSDLPSIRRQHMTDGYREGLSIGKAKVMQRGFDEGYPIGIEVGLRVGEIFGVLEGYLAYKSIHIIPGMADVVRKTYAKAQSELVITQLLKNVDENTLSTSRTIPDSVSRTLEHWEGLVLGVWMTRRETQRRLYEQNGDDLRDMAAEAKHAQNVGVTGGVVHPPTDEAYAQPEHSVAVDPLAGSAAN